jgi:hypothetical protein
MDQNEIEDAQAATVLLPAPDSDVLWSVKQTAAYYGITAAQARAAIERGDIPARRIPGRHGLIVFKSEAEAHLKRIARPITETPRPQRRKRSYRCA